MNDTQPLERKRHVSLEQLLEAVAFGSRDQDILSSVASRIARLDQQLTPADREIIQKVSGGVPLGAITCGIVTALDPDTQVEAAQQENGGAEPTAAQTAKAADRLLTEAAKPIACNPELRKLLVSIKKAYEQIIDTVSKDEVIDASFSEAAKEKAKSVVRTFERFIAENKDEITALQVLYSKPYKQRLTFKQIQELAQALERPQDGIRGLTPDVLWHAYETLDRSKVRGSGGRVLTDIVSLVRFAIHQQPDLYPYQEDVNARFARWMAQQEQSGRAFTAEQRQWLESIRDHIATSVELEMDDLELSPFSQKGGLGRAYQVFGNDLGPLVNELNEVLAA